MSKNAWVVISTCVVAMCLWFVIAAHVRSTSEHSDLYPIVDGGLYGYINSSGHVVIPPHFESAAYFYDGRARFVAGGKIGYINETGAVAIPPDFDDGEPFSEGMACVLKNGKWGYINTTGTFAIPPQFALNVCNSFHDGLALIDPALGDFSSTIHLPSVYYINKKGTPLQLPQRVLQGTDFNEERAWITSDTKQWYVIDKTGRIMSPAITDCLVPGPFESGLAAVQSGCQAQFGFVDERGNQIIAPQFDWAGQFADGLASVEVHNKYGYIDRSGRMTIPPTFAGAMDFENGAAFVTLGAKWGVINKAGTWIVPPQFVLLPNSTTSAAFQGELGMVLTQENLNGECDIKMRYLNHQGETVWGPRSVLPGMTAAERAQACSSNPALQSPSSDSSDTAESAPSPGTVQESMEMDGTVGTYRVGLNYTVRDGTDLVAAHYFYASQLKDIQLTGAVQGQTVDFKGNDGSVFHLHFVGNGSNGTEPLTFRNSIGLSGTWALGSRMLPVILTGGYSTANPGQRLYADVTDEPDAEFEAMVQAAKSAILTGDSHLVAKYVDFPLRVNTDNRHLVLHNFVELDENWSSVFPTALIEKIRLDVPHEMFVHEGQVMLGQGELWFNDKGLESVNVE